MKKDSKSRLFEVMGRLDKTFKSKLNENFEIEKPEMDEPIGEGSEYKDKLEEIVDLAKKAYKNFPEDELPSWIQDKIIIAREHLKDICGFLHSEEEHEESEVDDEKDEEDEKEEDKDDDIPENLKDITPEDEEDKDEEFEKEDDKEK